MKNWNEIMIGFSLFSNEERLLEEQKWLNEKYSQSCNETDNFWIELTDDEKQRKRIIASKQARKTDAYFSGFFKKEEIVVDLYEAIETCLVKLDDNSSDLLSIRMTAYLYLIKKIINCNRDVREIKNFYLFELRQVISDCLNSAREDYFIKYVNVLYLDSKCEILQHCMNNESPQL